MGIEDKNIPEHIDPSEVAKELNLKDVHSAAKRIFEDLEVISEGEYEDIEYVETGSTGLPELDAPRTRVTELEEEAEMLKEEYSRTAKSSLLRRLNKVQEEIYLRIKDNDPGEPLHDLPK